MSNLRPTLAAAFAGAASLVGQASAEPLNRGELEALFDEPVTTSATGSPQRVTEAPVNMVIISQEDIRRSGAIDLPGVLERLASVDVMRTSAGQADVTIRGYNRTSSPRLLVLLNGRQVYLDNFGATNWDTIPVQLAEIRQIEVVSGPNTALFGFNALSGVVNIITYDALQDDIDQVSTTIGAPTYAGGSAIWTARVAENFGFRLSLGGFNAEALPGDDGVARALSGADSAGPRARSAALNAAYDIGESVRADFEATWSHNVRSDRAQAQLFAAPYETNSFKLGLSGDTSLGLLSGHIYSNSVTRKADLGASSHTRTTVAAAALVAKPAPAHTMRLAGEYRHNAYTQGGAEIAYDIYSLSGMWNWQPDAAWAITSAARYDTLALERTGPFPANFPFTNADYDRTLAAWSYNIGAVYRLSHSDALRLSAAKGIGSPSLVDFGAILPAPRPGVSFFVAGDPNSTPTVVHNIELGWDHEAPLIGGRVRAALFWQRHDDIRAFASRTVVFSVFPPVIALLPQPIGDSEMHGIEVGADGQSGRLHWSAQYSWRHIQDALTVPPPVSQASYEETSPEHVATVGATWVGERFEIGADARFTSETLQFGQGTTLTGLYPVDSYMQANARLAWKATETLEIEVSGRNLLDSQTQTVGLTPVERSVYFTLRAGF